MVANDLQKYCFTDRVVKVWKSLLNGVVSANTTKLFLKTD